MFILSLTYIAPLEQVDTFVDAHMTWVNEGYDNGMFIASGRKVPRSGGVIFANGDRQAIEAFCAADPFSTGEVATYEITEVAFSRTADGLEKLTS